MHKPEGNAGMADKKDDPRVIVLSDGRELCINLNAVTWPEIRETLRGAPFSDDPSEDSENRARYAGGLGKIVGMTSDEMQGLGFVDFRRIEARVMDALKDPLNFDPN